MGETRVEEVAAGRGANDEPPKYAQAQCTLCGDPVDPENPVDTVYDHSPRTFRRGWMHAYCARVAIEGLDEDRRDAYYQL